MNYGFDIPSQGALDLVSLGALVHRLSMDRCHKLPMNRGSGRRGSLTVSDKYGLCKLGG